MFEKLAEDIAYMATIKLAALAEHMEKIAKGYGHKVRRAMALQKNLKGVLNSADSWKAQNPGASADLNPFKQQAMDLSSKLNNANGALERRMLQGQYRNTNNNLGQRRINQNAINKMNAPMLNEAKKYPRTYQTITENTHDIQPREAYGDTHYDKGMGTAAGLITGDRNGGGYSGVNDFFSKNEDRGYFDYSKSTGGLQDSLTNLDNRMTRTFGSPTEGSSNLMVRSDNGYIKRPNTPTMGERFLHRGKEYGYLRPFHEEYLYSNPYKSSFSWSDDLRWPMHFDGAYANQPPTPVQPRPLTTDVFRWPTRPID